MNINRQNFRQYSVSSVVLHVYTTPKLCTEFLSTEKKTPNQKAKMEILPIENYYISLKLNKIKTLFKNIGTHPNSSPVLKHASTLENKK